MNLRAWIKASLIPVSYFLFAAWIIFLVNSNLLPDPVAIHWGITLQPDGFATLSQYLTINLGILGFLVLANLSLKVWLRELPLVNKLVGLATAGIYWLLIAILIAATVIQVAVTDARASSFPVAMIAIILLLIPISLWLFLAFPEIDLDNKLKVKLRGLKIVEVDYSKIQSFRIENISPWYFGGFGLRIRGKKIAFVPSKGKALILTLRSGEELAIRIDSGDEILAALSAKTKN